MMDDNEDRILDGSIPGEPEYTLEEQAKDVRYLAGETRRRSRRVDIVIVMLAVALFVSSGSWVYGYYSNAQTLEALQATADSNAQTLREVKKLNAERVTTGKAVVEVATNVENIVQRLEANGERDGAAIAAINESLEILRTATSPEATIASAQRLQEAINQIDCRFRDVAQELITALESEGVINPGTVVIAC